MPIEQTELESLIKNGFPDAKIEIRDLVGDKDHYEVRIVSGSFKGKSRVMQHKMVHAALKGTAGEKVHAISIITESGQ